MARPTTTPESRPLRLCFLCYRSIHELAMPILAEFMDRAEIEVVHANFAGALEIARDRIERGVVDAFVSAGSNAYVLHMGIDAPVATIKVSGFDLFQAILLARQVSNRIGIVVHNRIIPELDLVRELLNVEVAQYAYQTPDDARQRIDALRRDGFEVVIGSSLIVELAEQAGLRALLAYSPANIRNGFEDGLELARVARLEADRYEQLNSVLYNLQEAVLAVDSRHRIIALNPPMQRLLGHLHGALLGRRLDHVEPELSLQDTLDSGAEERGAVQHFKQRDWVINRTPIRAYGNLVGATVTLYDAHRIQEAATSLRMQQRSHQTAAKYSFDSLIGCSAKLQRAVETARRYARTDLSVLIVGESGVGKELFAQAIHNDSARVGRPFVAINCAAFPETLLESELFGYEEGAFTGSSRGGKRGLFEAAHTGTLFLDEIGDMPLSLQTRLLRVLQEQEITRLGATTPIPVDVRIIAATHQPLPELIEARRFRQDLYYRVSTLRLPLPSLRDRRDDIAPLAQMYLARALQKVGISWDTKQTLSPLLPYLIAHRWPGNVRELENICERVAVFLLQFARVDDIHYDGLRTECPELFEQAAALRDDPTALRDRVLQVMQECGHDRQRAAAKLGVSRSTLWRWLRKLST